MVRVWEHESADRTASEIATLISALRSGDAPGPGEFDSSALSVVLTCQYTLWYKVLTPTEYEGITTMTNDNDLKALEQDAFSNAHSDGIFDLFVGISLMWIGIAWLWLPDLAGLAGVFPAIFIAPVIQMRKKLVEPRIGYVKWSDSRESKERRSLTQMLAFGVFTLAIGLGVFFLATQTDADTDVVGSLVPALPAWLLGIGAAMFGLVSGVGRAYAYAVILGIAGGATIWLDQGPGLGLFVSGIVMTLISGVMVSSFFGRYRTVDAS